MTNRCQRLMLLPSPTHDSPRLHRFFSVFVSVFAAFIRIVSFMCAGVSLQCSAAPQAESVLLPAVDSALGFEYTPVVIPARLSAEYREQDFLQLVSPDVRSAAGQPLAAAVCWLLLGSEPDAPGPDLPVTRGDQDLAWTFLGETVPVLREVSPPDIQQCLTEYPSQTRPFIIIPWDTHLRDGALTVNGRLVRIAISPVPAGDLGEVGDWLDYPGSVGGRSRTPFEAFRRTLMHQQADLSADSSPPESPLLRALARQNTQRWLFGIERFAAMPGMQSGSVLGSDLRHILTRECRDGPVQFAAWLNEPSRMARLELLLLAGTVLNPVPEDPDLSISATTIAAVLAAEPAAVFWVESDHGPAVRLAAANLSRRIIECDVSWETDPGYPVRQWALRPGLVERIALPRPERGDSIPAPAGTAVSGTEVIRIAAPWGTYSLATDPPQLSVIPPGVRIARFVSAWRQPSWLNSRVVVADDSRGTSVTIQRGPQGWELIVNADRAVPLAQSPSGDVEAPSSEPPDGLRPTVQRSTGLPVIGLDPSFVESLSLIVGPADNPLSIVTIEPYRQHGQCTDWLDSGLDSAEVIIKARPDRWSARVPIPESWVNDNGMLDVGFVRSHAGLSSIDVFPRPCFPWRLDPGRVRFDLSKWLPMPGTEGH